MTDGHQSIDQLGQRLGDQSKVIANQLLGHFKGSVDHDFVLIASGDLEHLMRMEPKSAKNMRLIYQKRRMFRILNNERVHKAKTDH